MGVRTGIAMALAIALTVGATSVQAQSPQQPPKLQTDVGTLFGPDAYPPSALRAEEQGRVVVVLAIDALGRVTGCELSQSSGSQALDEVTCRQARTAVFDPARDERGRKVAATLKFPVRWQLPDPDAPSVIDVAQGSRGNIERAMEVKVDADGIVSACRPLTQSLEGRCPGILVGQASPQRYVRDGKPIAVTVVVRSSETVTPAP